MTIVRGSVWVSIAKGTYCGFYHQGSSIGFTAPIDLIATDRVAVETESGQVLVIYRQEKGVIWEAEKTT